MVKGTRSNLNTSHHKKCEGKAGDTLQGDRESNGKERGMEKKRVDGRSTSSTDIRFSQ